LANEHELGDGDEFRKYVANELPFFSFAPVAFISAKSGNRVGKLLQYALEIARERQREIPQEELDSFVEMLKIKHGAVVGKGKDSQRPKIHGIRQIGVKPPTFSITTGSRDVIHPNFLKFVEKRLRERYGFVGTPIVVLSRAMEASSRK
jgi:GTP-binding protein